MWENFQRMAQQQRDLHFDFVPETFVLPQQLRSFKQRYLKTRWGTVLGENSTLMLAYSMVFLFFFKTSLEES